MAPSQWRGRNKGSWGGGAPSGEDVSFQRGCQETLGAGMRADGHRAAGAVPQVVRLCPVCFLLLGRRLEPSDWSNGSVQITRVCNFGKSTAFPTENAFAEIPWTCLEPGVFKRTFPQAYSRVIFRIYTHTLRFLPSCSCTLPEEEPLAEKRLDPPQPGIFWKYPYHVTSVRKYAGLIPSSVLYPLSTLRGRHPRAAGGGGVYRRFRRCRRASRRVFIGSSFTKSLWTFKYWSN